MLKNVLTAKIIVAFILFTLAFGQLGQCLAAPAAKADELINQLSVISEQTKTEKTFSEIIDLTENAVKLMQQEYFEIDEDYTDAILGEKLTTVALYLSQIAQNNADIYNSQLKILEQQQKDFNDKKDKSYAQMTAKIKEMNDYSAKMAGLTTRRTQLQSELTAATLQANAARATLAEVENDYENFKKWHWVLGYGQYLGVKNIINKSQRIEENTSPALRNAQCRVNELDQEARNLNNNFENLQNTVEIFKKEITSYEEQIIGYTEQINASTKKKLQYGDMVLFFEGIATTFEYTNSGVKSVLNALASVRFKQYNGHLIRSASGQAIYFVIDGKALHIQDPKSFNAVFLDAAWNSITIVQKEIVDSFPKGEIIKNPTLRNDSKTGKVYFVSQEVAPEAKKYWIINPDTFNDCSFNWDKIQNADTKFEEGSNLKYGIQ